ncbi:MAG: metallophosphoesterase, partial [Myxococcales bacterium]|nr:metallophosphoesterase [Myxococcales bacterium]
GAAPVRIVQITDPHLGPLMSVARLRGICERAVAQAPDLIVITGDFMTMESQTDPRTLHDALEPLAAFECPVLACFGNHDHEAPTFVRQGLADVGARLLVDEAALVETPAGPVQLLGFDFIWRDRDVRLAEVCRRHPRIPGALRLALLHDPGAFRHVPEGQVDLALSGHTHGGQIFPFGYAVRAAQPYLAGLVRHGPTWLYVHQGTGTWGPRMRVGTLGEIAVITLQGRVRSDGGSGGRT